MNTQKLGAKEDTANRVLTTAAISVWVCNGAQATVAERLQPASSGHPCQQHAFSIGPGE